jgi:hypothetical protein
LLILLTDFSLLLAAESIDVFQDTRKVCWTIQLNLLQRRVVSIKNALHAVALWFEDVAVQSEAVRGRVVWSSRKLTAEAVGWVHLVGVVVLDDAHN